MRKEIRDMKEQLVKKERALIDIGRKPVLAIDNISQPIFEILKKSVEG